jgi:hypothetical protein
MPLRQYVIVLFGLALLLAAAAGTFARHRYRLWWSFAVYLLAVTLSTALQAFWPERFVTAEFWQFKETAYMVLRFAMAIELGFRTLRHFPGAFAIARRLIFVVVAVTFIAVFYGPRGEYPVFLGERLPRVLNGSAWTLITLSAVILWYRIPLLSFQKSILLSYIPYLIISTIVLRQFAVAEFHRPVWQYVNQLTYVALLTFWNYAIWRRDNDMRIAPARSGSA